MKKLLLLLIVALPVVLSFHSPSIADAQDQCTVTTVSQPGEDIRLLTLDAGYSQLIYTDTVTNNVFIRTVSTSPIVTQIGGTLPAPVVDAQWAGGGLYVFLTLENNTLLLINVSAPDVREVITERLVVGPVENESGSQFTFVQRSEDDTRLQAVIGFYGFTTTTRELGALSSNADWLDIAFTNSGNTITSLTRLLNFEVWPILPGGETDGPTELSSNNDIPAQMQVLPSSEAVVVQYQSGSGQNTLSVINTATDGDRDTIIDLSAALVSVGQPIIVLEDDTLIYAENTGSAYRLMRSSPDGLEQTELATNLSASCYSAEICSFYALLDDVVVYRGVDASGNEGFYGVPVSGLSAPLAFFEGTRSLIFYGVQDTIVALEPLRVEGEQVIFALNRHDLDGSSGNLAPGLRWPINSNFLPSYVQFAPFDGTLTFAGNPGLGGEEDLRLFRVALRDEDGFPRRLTEQSVDIFGNIPVATSNDAVVTLSAARNDDSTRSLIEVVCIPS